MQDGFWMAANQNRPLGLRLKPSALWGFIFLLAFMIYWIQEELFDFILP